MDQTTSPRATILLVEDDPVIAQLEVEALESSGYRVWHTEKGADAKAMLEEIRPDLIVLDLMLPDLDGLVLSSKLKTISDVPIIICSALNEKRERVLGLKLGADDFIPKPFDLDELEARVEAVLRRTAHLKSAESGLREEIRVGQLVMDRSRRRVALGGRPIHLTPTEYRLLSTLASRAGEEISREELAQHVWGYQDVSTGRTIDVHIRRLRIKLRSGPVLGPSIGSVRGFGYKLNSEPGAPYENSIDESAFGSASADERRPSGAGGSSNHTP